MRVHSVLKRCAILIFALSIVTGCTGPKVRERFTHATIHPDEKSGLFVFKREHYYDGDIFLGIDDQYVVNTTIIGSYDFASGKVRVLYRRDNGNKYLDEAKDFHIVQIYGNRALVNGSDAYYNWLDLNTGAMTPVRLVEELAAQKREVGYIYLVDEQGTLVFDNTALGEWNNYSAPRELWVRRPTGEYVRVGERSGFTYGYRNNEVYFFIGPACQLYSLNTRTQRPCETRDIPRMKNPNPTIDFQADMHGSPQLTIGRKVATQWVREEVPINTRSLR